VSNLSRRQLIGSVAAGAALASVAGLGGCAGAKPMPKYAKSDFYGPDGKFNAAAAKQAYYALMEHHGYPIPRAAAHRRFLGGRFRLGQVPRGGHGRHFLGQ